MNTENNNNNNNLDAAEGILRACTWILPFWLLIFLCIILALWIFGQPMSAKALLDTTHQVFLPLISKPYIQDRGKGLAMGEPADHLEDLVTLGASKYYVYSEELCYGAENCIPMLWDWRVKPGVPALCYETIMTGNEPTNPVFGYIISPNDAVTRTLALEAKCPNARIVAGNEVVGGYSNNDVPMQWIIDYLTIYKNRTGHTFGSNGRDIFGLHCYVNSNNPPGFCESRILFAQNVTIDLYGPPGNRHPFWITEFNVLAYHGARIDDFQALLEFFDNPDNRVSWVFAFTNRGWGADYVDLIDENGNPANNGPAYAAWQYP